MKRSTLLEDLHHLTGHLHCETPQELELIEWGQRHHLGLYRTLALLLKAEHERSADDGQDGADNNSFVWPVGQSVRARQALTTDRLYEAFKQQDLLPDGYTRAMFALSVRELRAADLHLAATDSIELSAFAERQQKMLALSTAADSDQQRGFGQKKQAWLQALEQLGELLLLVEQRRLTNAQIEQRYLAIFGEEYHAVRVQIARYDGLRQRLEILKEQPELSTEELELQMQDREAQEEQKLREVKLQLLLARAGGAVTPATETASAAELKTLRQDTKRILRELWMLLHPDRLFRHPKFPDLTALQQQELDKLWHICMAVRPDELNFAPGQVGHQFRALDVLNDALSSAKTILENAGIDTDVRLIIQGDTLAEQIAWLDKATAVIARQCAAAQAELKLILEDTDIQRKAALLESSPQQQEQARSALRAQAAHYRELSEALAAELSRRLPPAAASAASA